MRDLSLTVLLPVQVVGGAEWLEPMEVKEMILYEQRLLREPE